MTADTLIFKEKTIHDNDLELIFHRDVFWIYDENPFPVVKYTLVNCKNLESIKLDLIDYYNDGLVVDTRQEGGLSVFETTDMGNFKIKIICDIIKKEELEYDSRDFIGLIKEILKQRDNNHETVVMLTKREDSLKQFLNHELDIVTRKITQANWLTEDKKHFLQGQQAIIKKTLEVIGKK
jgi:hypothetical protein